MNDVDLTLRKPHPAYLSRDYVRMWDLVRYQRHELHEAGLISNEEYAALVGEEPSRPGTGSPSAKRLSSYDELRAENASLRQKLRDAQAILPRLKPCGHDGDEETGVHDEDCQRCAYDELEAALEEADESSLRA